MNHRHNCTDCHQPIHNGRAFLRTVAFEKVAFCASCYAVRSGIIVPRPRFARPVSEVLAEARRAH